jgi:hypothetical protein
MVIDLLGYTEDSIQYGSDLYPGGNTLFNQSQDFWVNYTDLGLKFRAVFESSIFPATDIKANESDGPITITTSDLLWD